MRILSEVELSEYDDDELAVEQEMEEASGYVKYDIATYPSDLTLGVIHEMKKDKEITIPKFQRNFVWNIKQSSLLVESFLLGLPVPQVFFYIDSQNKNLVLDGQQRIMSIVFFFEGYFGHENLQGRRQVFRLTGLSESSPYKGKRFEDLDESDRRRLKGSVLRAVNIRQLSPDDSSTSMYHIFERLNTGGTPLKPQEIRNCVFHGGLVELLQDLNELEDWRTVIGQEKLNKFQRDVEMILRVFAMSENAARYDKPMKEFLNRQMGLHKSGKTKGAIEFRDRFKGALKTIIEKLPERPFHVRGPINLAALDSILGVMVAKPNRVRADLEIGYADLIQNQSYQDAIYFNTSDNVTVQKRLQLAEQYLLKK